MGQPCSGQGAFAVARAPCLGLHWYKCGPRPRAAWGPSCTPLLHMEGCHSLQQDLAAVWVPASALLSMWGSASFRPLNLAPSVVPRPHKGSLRGVASLTPCLHCSHLHLPAALLGAVF